MSVSGIEDTPPPRMVDRDATRVACCRVEGGATLVCDAPLLARYQEGKE
jgi:hypothetical protein